MLGSGTTHGLFAILRVMANQEGKVGQLPGSHIFREDSAKGFSMIKDRRSREGRRWERRVTGGVLQALRQKGLDLFLLMLQIEWIPS